MDQQIKVLIAWAGWLYISSYNPMRWGRIPYTSQRSLDLHTIKTVGNHCRRCLILTSALQKHTHLHIGAHTPAHVHTHGCVCMLHTHVQSITLCLFKMLLGPLILIPMCCSLSDFSCHVQAFYLSPAKTLRIVCLDFGCPLCVVHLKSSWILWGSTSHLLHHREHF